MVQRSRTVKLKGSIKRLVGEVDTANFWAFLAIQDISEETYKDATRLWEHYLTFLTDRTVDYKPKGDLNE